MLKNAARKRKMQDDDIEIEEISETKSTSSPTSRGPSNILIILLILVSFFAGYLFYKVKNLEQLSKQGNNPAAPNAQIQGATASPLSVENLKKYAKDLKLDTRKFNSCLDQGQKTQQVTKDTNEGTSLNVRGTPGFFINGKFLGGAFPFELFKEIIDKELEGKASNTCADYSTELQNYCDDTGKDQNKPFNPVPRNVSTDNMPARGLANAKVTIIEFSDFECPYCIRAYNTVKQVSQTYPNDVKIYYKQFPLTSIHPNSQKAAEASLCAGDQGKFWQYHDKLFETQSSS